MKSPFRSHARTPKSRNNTSWLYAVLCLALAGFLVWIWRNPKHAPPAPVVILPPTNQVKVVPPPPKPLPVVAPPKTNEPVVLVAATTNHPVESILDAQIALARQKFSPGSIDGLDGPQTRSALIAFQQQHSLTPTGELDENTKALLILSAPPLTAYTITSNDLARLLPLAPDWLGKSKQPRLDFENILELLGEKTLSHPKLIRSLNPNINWDAVTAGTEVLVPQVEYPPATNRAALVKISLQNRVLEVFDENTNLLAHFPCSIGRLAAKRPVGELRVQVVVFDPNYTFDPAVFPESPEAQKIHHKLIIPPGPNNPVGVAWVGLNRPGYGIHGTPVPEQVGRTESHGCFRLANWNADYFAHVAFVGMPVFVEP